MAKLIPLYSGSSGNCTYIGSGSSGILIDVGKSARATCRALMENSIDPSGIRGIFITHEHSDHVAGVDVLARKLNIPVYGNEKTLEAMEKKEIVSPRVNLQTITNGIDLGDFFVDTFQTQHDSAQCCGFTVEISGGKKAGIATDLGLVTPAVLQKLENCVAVMLESNYDEDMLRQSMYPYPLKQRIASPSGHLANKDCAAVLPHLVQKGVLQIVLAHLSKENNLPELAKTTSVRSLASFDIKENIDYQIRVARRCTVTAPIVF